MKAIAPCTLYRINGSDFVDAMTVAHAVTDGAGPSAGTPGANPPLSLAHPRSANRGMSVGAASREL